MSCLMTVPKSVCGATVIPTAFAGPRQRLRRGRILSLWQHFLPRFDLLVFDFRNHAQNVPVVPSHALCCYFPTNVTMM